MFTVFLNYHYFPRKNPLKGTLVTGALNGQNCRSYHQVKCTIPGPRLSPTRHSHSSCQFVNLSFFKKRAFRKFSKNFNNFKTLWDDLKIIFKILKCLPERPRPYLNVNQKKLKVLSFSFSLIGFPMSNNL